MSQLAQAKRIDQDATQGFEEIRADFARLAKDNEEGKLSPEAFKAKHDELSAKLDELDAEFDRAQSLSTLSTRFEGIASRVRRPAPVRPQVDPGGTTDPSHRDSADTFAAQNIAGGQAWSTFGADDPRRYVTLRRGSRERNLLNRFLRPSGLPIRQSLTSEDMSFLMAPRGDMLMSAYVDSGGAYVTAEEFRNELIQVRAKVVGLAQRVRTIPTQAAMVSFPSFKMTVTFTKRGRGAAASTTPTTLSKIYGKTSFVPYGQDLIVKVPKQLVEDATYDIIEHLAREIDRESREDDENFIINGTGASEPLGILTGLVKIYTAGGTSVGWDGVSGFAGAAFTEEDIQVWDVQLHAAAVANASVLCGRAFEQKVRLFRTKPGGDGTGDFMFKRALEFGQPNTLNGFPILRSEWFPDNITTGSTGDPMAVLVDLDDYWWVTRTGLNVRVLDQLYAETNEYGYQYEKRQDGAMVRADAAVYLRRQA